PLPTVETFDEPISLWHDAWYRLQRHRLTIFGLVLVLILAFTAIFGPSLTPYAYLSQNPTARTVLPSPSHLFGTDDLS
ncbi:ABC transporter permease, partial [Rhizobium johnstonii]